MIDCLASKLIGSLLEGAILLLKSKAQEVVKSSLIFVRVRYTFLYEFKQNFKLISKLYTHFYFSRYEKGVSSHCF